MSTNPKTVTLEVTAEQLAAFEKVLAMLPQGDAPAVAEEVTECGAETKAGTACKNNAATCRHHTVTEAPKAKKGKAKKAAPKAEEATATLLRKATRKQFIKAAAEQFEVDLTGWSCRDIAASVVAGELEVPEGFAIGDGYTKLVKGQYEL